MSTIKIIVPLANKIRMQLNQCFFSFDLSTVAGHTESEIIEKANTHAQQLSQYLHQLKSNKKLEFVQPIS